MLKNTNHAFYPFLIAFELYGVCVAKSRLIVILVVAGMGKPFHSLDRLLPVKFMRNLESADEGLKTRMCVVRGILVHQGMKIDSRVESRICDVDVHQ